MVTKHQSTIVWSNVVVVITAMFTKQGLKHILQTKMEKSPCTICQVEHNKVGLKIHMIHRDKKLFKCGLCHYKKALLENVSDHKERFYHCLINTISDICRIYPTYPNRCAPPKISAWPSLINTALLALLQFGWSSALILIIVLLLYYFWCITA